MNFTHDERFLMLLYSPGTRQGLIGQLRAMQRQLAPDERALAALTKGTLSKLEQLTDAEFLRLDLFDGLG